jgi:translocation and assembly module TamB
VVERNKPIDFSRAVEEPARKGAAIALDVTLKAPRRVFLRGRGLDVELSLDARVGGTTARPVLSGTARVVRGEYDFAGKRFEFDDRSVVYLATSPEAIRLDLSATREDPSLTAVVRIRGTAARPEITLTSTPVLPNDEVLSQVLFGRSASQLSPLEAAQLASALSALAGGGGFDVIGNLRNFAGLDRLALGGGDASGVTVSGGKYLTDNVYLELTGGGREGSSAQVEWRIRRKLSIISKLASQGDGKLAVRWRTDY